MEDNNETEEREMENTEEAYISIHAITGMQSSQTMQIGGSLKGYPLLILIDSGSIHSFLDAAWARELNLQIEHKEELREMVANGERVSCEGICCDVPVLLGNFVFKIDLLLLSVTGLGAVLAVNWLKTLGPITWDFNLMSMSFIKNGQLIALRGIKESRFVSPRALSTSVLSIDRDSDLQRLLAKFHGIFQEPTGLPPSRACNHRILLEASSLPVVVWSYRYPHLQKHEIEKQCQEMLDKGVIHPSQSPFSSPCC